MNKIYSVGDVTFEGIKQVDAQGREFWSARKLAPVLEYAQFQNFVPVIEKAKLSCTQAGYAIADHFMEVHEMVVIGSGGQREIADVRLDRYACYLIVQNGDPKKPVIARGQTYFAVQTRRQELADEEESFLQDLNEDQMRVMLRHQMRTHNTQLADAARAAGVISSAEFAIFQNHGYQGLYDGLGVQGIHTKKGLKKSQKILDHMGSTELAANLFRATQAEDKLRRDRVQGKAEANRTHFAVGQKVRQTIEELGGVMPEALPTPSDSVKVLEQKYPALMTKKP
jgi:DNA-damage-inducible protein D